MYVKIGVPLRRGEFWVFECDRVHYYKLTLREFWKFMEKDGFSLTLFHPDTVRPLKVICDESNNSEQDAKEGKMNATVKIGPDAEALDKKDTISVASLNTKTEQGYTIAFDTVGYLLNEKGRTIERLWTEPAALPKRDQ